MTREALYHALRFERQADQLELRAEDLRRKASALRATAKGQDAQAVS